jgi:hypothetical protein
MVFCSSVKHSSANFPNKNSRTGILRIKIQKKPNTGRHINGVSPHKTFGAVEWGCRRLSVFY